VPVSGRADVGNAHAAAKRAASSPWVGRIARLGVAARGALYLLVGLLAIAVPLGLRNRTPDREGALRVLSQQPFGKVLLALIALGLAGYAVWRFSQGFLGRKQEGGGKPGIAKRVGYIGLGFFYAFTAGIATALVLGVWRASSNEKEETATVFDLPLGRYAVGAVGVGLLVAGLVNLYRSLTAKFREYLREYEVGKKARDWVIAVGVAGHLARAAVFALVGTFVLKAAIEYDAREAIGLDGALAKLAHQPYGPILLGLVAAGLLAYALFCFVMARYAEL
jgi:hypothetical protein